MFGLVFNLGLGVLALQFGIRSARISGMGLEGAIDPMMLGLLWDSPLGMVALWRGAGQLLIFAVLIEGKIGLAASLLGALLVAVSYTLVGHSLGDPRWLLAALVGVHLLAGAFWAPWWRGYPGSTAFGVGCIAGGFGGFGSISAPWPPVVDSSWCWVWIGGWGCSA